jgi:hypothetical protein
VTHSPRAALDPLGRRWDRSVVPGSGSHDDTPAPGRGAVRPPASLTPGDAPAIEVPRMDPPPASLEAMVQSAQRAPSRETGSSWWLWVALIVAAAAITGYVMR